MFFKIYFGEGVWGNRNDEGDGGNHDEHVPDVGFGGDEVRKAAEEEERETPANGSMFDENEAECG